MADPLQPETRVVHVKSSGWDTYIGRAMPSFGLPHSKFANPFKIGPDGTRAEVIKRYEQYLVALPGLFAQISVELRGHTLACWCKPQRCHGEVLARIADAICINCRMRRGKYDPHTATHVCANCQTECDRVVSGMLTAERKSDGPNPGS